MSDIWESDALKHQTEFQEQYATWREYPRTFTGYLKTHIGLLLFGMAENMDPNTPLMQYHEFYDEKQKKTLNTIFDKIMTALPDDGFVHFNSTFLTLKTPKKPPFLYVVFRCRSPANLNKIYFIEPNGRVYNDWSDFTNNNKLPKCEYITCQNGVYYPGGAIMKFKSPAAEKGLILESLDWAATFATVGSIAAGVFAVAPVTAACAGIGAGVYGVGSSVLAIRDRVQHRESVGLNNKESVLHYANITASGLTGVGSLAIANANKISNFFGSYSRFALGTIRAVGYTAVIFDGAFFLVNLHDFWGKFRNDQLSSRDIFNLSLQLFVLYGAVVNVRDMHRTLSEVQQGNVGVNNLNVSNKKLTKTQKRNLQKRRAKARQRELETGANAVRVVECDRYASVKQIAFHGGLFGVKFLLQRFPRAEVIVDELVQVRNLITAYVSERINLMELIYGFSQHLENLSIILKEDLGNIRTFLAERFPSVPNNDDVAQLMNNEMDRIEQASEDIYTVSVETNSTTESPVTHEENYQEPDNSDQRRPSNHKIILEAAKCIIMKCEVLESGIAVVLSFHDALMFVIKELETFFEKYDYLLSFNTERVGEEKAKRMLQILGTKTETDFFPNKKMLDEQAMKAADKVDEFLDSNAHVRGRSDTLSVFVCDVVGNLLSLVDNLFTVVIADSTQIGLNRLIGVLKMISVTLVENLTIQIEKCINDRDNLFRENSEILGEEYAHEMLRSIGMPTNELDVFKAALSQLDDCKNDIILSVLENYAPNAESGKSNPVINHRVNAESNPTETNRGHIIFTTACEKFYQKIITMDSTDDERSEMFKKIVHFVGSKILNELNLFKSDCEILRERNVDIIGPRIFRAMLRNIAAPDQSSFVNNFCEKMDKDDNLISEFFSYIQNPESGLEHLKIWDNTIGEEGFTAFRVECRNNEEDEYYLNFAVELFKVPLNSSVKVNRNENFIFFKSEEIAVTFRFSNEDANTAIVILVDLNKKDDPDQEECSPSDESVPMCIP